MPVLLPPTAPILLAVLPPPVCSVIMADEDVANAVQPHPHLPVLATSGIESTIKVGWLTPACCAGCRSLAAAAARRRGGGLPSHAPSLPVCCTPRCSCGRPKGTPRLVGT